ncbi:carbon-nitrogen family hydrolase [Streptomyces luteireticuli]|uniref:Carbon-nitrogen family hydrolase n=1 Tax=Streptomyces luteireticuli TaxID=173858 RepID=A0ABN0YZE7_9ACTN
MRVSLIQLAVDPAAESPDERRERVAGLVRAERGSDLVVLPELWTTGAFASPHFLHEAESPADGPTSRLMSAAARDAGVWLHAGSIIEQGGEDGLFNTSLVFDPSGKLVRTYRKIHLFGFDEGEAVLMTAGREPVTLALPETVIGLATCYDLRFPELFRALVDAGAETLVVPAGWPAARRAHWTLLAQARAVEDQAYVLAVGTAGTNGGVEQAGYSIAVDPWGEVLAEAGAEEEILRLDLDMERVARTRKEFPALRNRVLGVPCS